MNVQVMLLAGITGIFMLAWNGDPACCKDEHAVAVYPAPLRVYAADTIDRAVVRNEIRPVFRSTVVARVASADVARSISDAPQPPATHSVAQLQATIAATAPAAGRPIPIPAGLPGGHYKAVSNQGDVREIILPMTDNDSASDAPADFYTTQADGVCWYFARINR